MAYTQKQIDKFHRQKYINELEKMGKNLFRMFRDEKVSAEQFLSRFTVLKKKFDEKNAIQLDSEYHQQLKTYIERLFLQTCGSDALDEEGFANIREAEMSNLNRLQKLKNGTTYKKEKHRTKHQNEDWG